MSNPTASPRRVSRITCQVHHRLSHRVTECLVNLGVDSVLVESGRTVRQLRKSRPFKLPGAIVRLDDAPAEIFRVTVAIESESTVMEALIRAAELDAPGRGSIFAQQLDEYGEFDLPAIKWNGSEEGDKRESHALLHDLTLITCILSMQGSGEQIARLALDLGSCVPVVTLGTGTGVRDRLGLLRITVPPEKEIVHLLVPEHDANEIMRLLIEEGRLDRPGRGFVYRTPVRAGLLDTSLRIGRQEHAASVEQIIAAVDELKRGTGWRRRFAAIDPGRADPTRQLRLGNRELALICSEGRAGTLIEAAIAAGAGGATTSKLRRMTVSDEDTGVAARERSTISVPGDQADSIIAAMIDAGAVCDDQGDRIQVLDAPAVFAHRS